MATVADFAVVMQGLATTGRGAGARAGDWRLQVVESGDIADDRLILGDLRTVEVEQNARTEKHLLRPYDVVVTARSQSVKTALVPPSVARTVAASTLLVVRASEAESGLAHYLWYFFASAQGRARVEAQLTASATLASLSAKNLAKVRVPLPAPSVLHTLADLVEASERAYAAGLEAARLRRGAVRDAIIGAIGHGRA